MRRAATTGKYLARISVLVLVVSVFLPLVGPSLARRAVATGASEAASTGSTSVREGDDSVELLPPSAKPASGVRALPLRTLGGAVDSLLTTGEPLDVEAADEVIDDLASDLGLQDEVRSGEFDEPFEILSTVEEDGTFRYDVVDQTIASGLERVGPVDSATVLDLSAALTAVAGANGGFSESSAGDTGAAVAYSLLRQVADADDCDLLTNLAFLSGIGVGPTPTSVRTTTDRATAACGDQDPTPAWASAKYFASTTTIGQDDRSFPDPPSRRRTMAIDAFEELQQDHPDLPVGWAGEADMLLGWADASDEVGVKPFQARRWREEALALYLRARSVSPDERLLAGHARALLGLGRADEAARVLAADAAGSDLQASMLRATILSARGDHAAAVATIEDESDSRRPWWSGRRPSIARPDFYAGAFAVDEYPPIEVFDAASQEFGGASVADSTFLPVFRYSAPEVGCRGARLLDELLLTDEPEQVLRALDAGVTPLDGTTVDTCMHPDYAGPGLKSPMYRAMALIAAGRVDQVEDALTSAETDLVTGELPTLADAWDRLQDLYRRVGDFDAARRSARTWVQELPEDSQAWQRLGEIDVLDGEELEARPSLERAAELLESSGAAEIPSAELTEEPSPRDDLSSVLTQLGATASGSSQTTPPALVRVMDLTDGQAAIQQDAVGTYATLTRLHVLRLLGQRAIDREDWARAVEDLTEANRIAKRFEREVYWREEKTDEDRSETVDGPLFTGAAENNLALAQARLGDTADAERAARSALAVDPANPVYLDTLGFVLQKGESPERAARAYEQAEAADSTSYVSTTNRAVLLAQDGKREEAESLLIDVVAAQPGYAMGWHTLGVVWYESWNPLDVLRAQGALGRAASLDSHLRGEDDLAMDDTVYRSGLDVARLGSNEWRYGSSAAAVAERATWSVLVLLVLRALWVLGLDRVLSKGSERVMRVRSTRWSWWGARPRPFWAVGATLVVLAGPMLGRVLTLAGLWTLIATVGLVAAPLLLRQWAANRFHQVVRHRSWSPTLAIGVAGTAVGFSFAPFPVLDDEAAPSRLVRWIAPAAIALAGGAALVIAWTTGAPLPRVLAASALVLLASILTPVRPLDGAMLTGRRVQAGVTLLLGAGTLGLALQWF